MAVCKLAIPYKGSLFTCLYDVDDYLLISQYKWTISKGYAKSGKVYMSRLILGVVDPDLLVDHIDHNGLNNQRSNLRTCTMSENQFNRVKQKSSSRFKGVYREGGLYKSMIQCNHNRIYLGKYRSEITAAKAYDQASRELHKEYGLRNFSEVDEVPKQLTLGM